MTTNPTTLSTFNIGVQRRHPSEALSVVVTERQEDALTDEQRAAHDKALEEAGQAPQIIIEYTVRTMGTLKPGLAYPEIAEHLGKVIASLVEREPAGIYLLIDVTGLGAPIKDLYRAQLAEAEALLLPCVLTSNEQCTWGEDERGKRQITVGKRWILNQLQILLQTNRLKLLDSPVARDVMDDLLHPVLPEIDAANDSLLTGGFSVGRHDGLLTALGLTVVDTHRRGRVGGWIVHVPQDAAPVRDWRRFLGLSSL